MNKIVFIAFSLLFTIKVVGQLQSPESFLPTQYGHSFTPHHEVVAYVQHVARESKNVKLIEYGRTNEDRPLLICFISSPKNLENLEEIRKAHMSDLGLEKQADKLEKGDKAIVWLSYSVHGNEAGGTESSLKTLYQLASGGSADIDAYLENTIVILDPCLNPDGFARYTNWVRGVEKKNLYPEHDDNEHHEPWPGGRVNHYLFDLNRDWAWATQIETQQRLKLYDKWMPHVHADFHEMGHDNHYYFPPAAKPYHNYISTFQRSFQEEFGKNHAKYFDANGWLYFTNEVFDLFYPGFGDTYPIFNGAIGMTYEQAGGPQSGRAILTSIGDTLTLMDRILHHATVALSTIEVSSHNATKLIDNQIEFFTGSKQKYKGRFKAYVLKASPQTKALTDLLDRHRIEYNTSPTTKNLNGYHYLDHNFKTFTIEPGDIIVSANQPKSVLAQVLLEPEHFLEDSLTYDITAWSLPYAYGIDAYGLAVDPAVIVQPKRQNDEIINKCDDSTLAIGIEWESLANAQQLSQLISQGVKLHLATKKLIIGGQDYKPGSFFILKRDQADWQKTKEKVYSIFGAATDQLHCIHSGYSDGLNDLGGSGFSVMKAPKVLTISGDETSAQAYGQILYYFEKVVNYPITSVTFSRLKSVDISNYTTLILPDGDYKLESTLSQKIESWVSAGGNLIVLGDACRELTGLEGFNLKKAEECDMTAIDSAKQSNVKYEDRNRNILSQSVNGAIIKTKIDNTHPLAYGMGDYYFTLMGGSNFYTLSLDSGWVVAKNASPPIYSGFIGDAVADKLKDAAFAFVEEKGSGKVVYLPDNPLFRGFWYNGLFLFSNAIFQL